MSKPDLSSLPSLINEDVIKGNVLAGDDIDEKGLIRWYMEEENAFYDSENSNCEEDPWYKYMCFVNKKLTRKPIEKFVKNAKRILFVGPGSGDEVYFYRKTLKKAEIFFLEASKDFQKLLLEKFPCSKNIQPRHSGEIDIENNYFDIIFFFSVLHHIPNVSKVIDEASRVCKKGGLVIMREPCTSMGNWRKERSSTPNERGISKKVMLKFAAKANLKVIKMPIPMLLEPINKFLHRNNLYKYVNFKLLYFVDRILSKFASFQDYYWRDNFWKKIGPSTYYYFFLK